METRFELKVTYIIIFMLKNKKIVKDIIEKIKKEKPNFLKELEKKLDE